MSLIESALGRFVPKVRVGTQYLKEQLAAREVKVRVSDGCIEDLVRDAIESIAQAPRTDEPYLTCLRRELDARAEFISEWTGSDAGLDSQKDSTLIAIARRYALPRPWKCRGPAQPTELLSEHRDTIPAHLVRKASSG
jgi:hypothetical protein